MGPGGGSSRIGVRAAGMRAAGVRAAGVRAAGVRAAGVRAAGVLAALGLTLAFAAPAAAQRRHFPVPRCGWVTASMIDHSFGLEVNAESGFWETQIAPVLNCEFDEQQAHLQEAGEPIALVQFREIQRFKPGKADVFVPHLGSCVKRLACPRPHKPAWLYVQQAGGGLATPFADATVLAVQDGLNVVVVTVVNPLGPLPVANETGAVEQLARELLPHFHWK